MDQLSYVVPDWLNVSRETTDRLAALCALVVRWNPSINLVSRASLADIWNRHLLDSAQLFSLSPPGSKTWADLGTGGGFPGLVIAVLAAERQPDLRLSFVESDIRKATFLQEACRTLGVSARILKERIESINPLSADVVSARALAPLTTLCGYAQRHLAPEGTALFLKGKSYAAEIAEARKLWLFDLTTHASKTDPDTVVLSLKGVRHV